LIYQWVVTQNFQETDSLSLKIEVLSLVLEKPKHARRHNGERITFEEFAQAELFADSSRLVVTAPDRLGNLGSGTEPIRLQSPLLLFLLIHQRERFEVLGIIEAFVKKIWNELAFLDF
jgi:hypothetical protein